MIYRSPEQRRPQAGHAR